MQHTRPWKCIRPTMSDALSRAERPANRTSELASSAEQPARMLAHSTSMDALNAIKQCILSADAEYYNNWKISDPYLKRKTIINLVGHLQSSMKAALHFSAVQPVSQGIPIEVLTAWLIFKCDHTGASIATVRNTLCDLANAEHRLFRMKGMVDKANALSEEEEFSEESQVDHRVLHECLQMCFLEVDQRKNALKELFRCSDEKIENW